MSVIRIGVTGSGFMGRTHVDAAHKLESTVPVAVTGGSRAPQLASDYGIDFEASVASLVARDDIDAIVVSTPHWMHCGETLAAAEAGKHVLVEKPMSISVEECDLMTEAMRKRNLILSVGYHQRFREANQRARECIRTGAIGEVRCIQTTALFDIQAMRADSGFGGTWSWWSDPRALAHLLNSAPHTVDLCQWCLGAEIVSAAALNGTFRENNPNENTTMAILSFSNGAMASFWSSSVCPSPGFPGEEFRFRFMGDDGIIDLDPYSETRIGRNGQWETLHQQPPVGHGDSNSAFHMTRMQAYCDQMQAFVESIRQSRSGSGGEGTSRDGRSGVAAVLAMLESARSQQLIKVD